MASPQDPNRLLTTQEAATRLNLSKRTMERLIASGDVPVVRLGRLVRVRPVDLELFVANRAGEQGGAR